MSQDICCFCLSTIDSDQSTIKLNCSHTYHNICWNQYGKNESCPLCRQVPSNIDQKLVHSTFDNYDPDKYVWVFGSFAPFSHDSRQNYIIYKIGHRQYLSGYFWRLFNPEITQSLEDKYNEYLSDKDKYSLDIEIGSSSYTILYDKIDIDSKFANAGVDFKVCIQQNLQYRYRPIIRMKWKDIIENLLAIGVHDQMFFNYSYLYYDKDHCYLFDMKNQEIINELYEQKQGNMQKIIINKEEYLLNIESNSLIDNLGNIIYHIDIFHKQKICNY